MLSADDYERLYRAYGRAAADREFDRQMRKEHIKAWIAGVILLILIVLAILTTIGG